MGATIVLLRDGLFGAPDRREAPLNLIRGETVETPGVSSARPLRVAERFYVHSVYVGSDVVEFGLMGTQPQAAQSGGRTWAKAVFLFPPEVLHSGDRAAVFRQIDAWFALEGTGPAPLAAAHPPAGVPMPNAATATVRIEAGMKQQEVLALLGPPVREVSFGTRAWLVYAGFVVQLEDGVVKSVENGGRPARVRVRSEPEGAEIYLGEKLVGSTPSTLELPPGRYVFIFRLNGFKPARYEIDVLSGGDLSVAVKMESQK
jgi:hypothetical protein